MAVSRPQKVATPNGGLQRGETHSVAALAHLVKVVLLPLFDLGVHVVHEVVADLEMQLAALVRLHQHALPRRLGSAVLGTWW